MRAELDNLSDHAIQHQTESFDDFNGFQSEDYWSDLSFHARRLAGHSKRDIAGLGELLLNVIERSGALEFDRLDALQGLADQVVSATRRLRDEVNKALRLSFVAQLKADERLLDELLQFVRSLEVEAASEDDTDELDEEEEEEVRPRSPIGKGPLMCISGRFAFRRSRKCPKGASARRAAAGRSSEWRVQDHCRNSRAARLVTNF